MENNHEDRSVAARWTKTIAEEGWTPISAYFLRNLQRLKTRSGSPAPLEPLEALVIIQIFEKRWNAKHPYITNGELARRLGRAAKTIRDTTKRLEDLGFVKRIPAPYGCGPNRFDFSGLFEALERLMAEDAQAAA